MTDEGAMESMLLFDRIWSKYHEKRGVQMAGMIFKHALERNNYGWIAMTPEQI